jgi:hypothetical protein
MIDIEIDALTNSITKVSTNESFETEVIAISPEDLKNLDGWHFNWTKENQRFNVFKLVTLAEPNLIQGLISWEVQKGFIFISLVETAPLNFGKNKIYLGVGGNLFAFACYKSFEQGLDGYVSFIAKTELVDYYKEKLSAEVLFGINMVIRTSAALKLINTYFNKK